MHPKNVLVTGGAGFAGSTLCKALRRTFPEARITAFDNLRRRGAEWNLAALKQARIEFVHGDVRHPGDLEGLRPDVIVECSAEPSAQAGYGGSPDYVVQTNLMGCYHCLELARRTQAAFLFLSTSRVYPYGLLNGLRFTESASRFELSAEQALAGVSAAGVSEAFPLTGARSIYGMTKLAAELMVEEYRDAYGIPTVINRFGLLTGPGQMAKSDQGVIALWVLAHLFERPLKYIGFGGTGKQVRDFLHVEDFCALVVDQIQHLDLYEGKVWNAGGGREFSLSLRELTQVCEQVTGRRIQIGQDPENRPADVRIYLTDASAVQAVNGWRPRFGTVATITDIALWLTSNREAVRELLL